MVQLIRNAFLYVWLLADSWCVLQQGNHHSAARFLQTKTCGIEAAHCLPVSPAGFSASLGLHFWARAERISRTPHATLPLHDMPLFKPAFSIPAAAASNQQQQQQQMGQQAGMQSAAQLQQQEARRPVPHTLTAAALFGTFFGDFGPQGSSSSRSSSSGSSSMWPCPCPVTGRQLGLQLLRQHLGEPQAELVDSITG